MPDRAPSQLPLAAIEPPRCASCNTRMGLARREPSQDCVEERTFSCQRCNRITTRTVSDPLWSPAVSALMRSLIIVQNDNCEPAR
jgi:hypothetical protein